MNTKKSLLITRGLPGSGKSTLASTIAENHYAKGSEYTVSIRSTDSLFINKDGSTIAVTDSQNGQAGSSNSAGSSGSGSGGSTGGQGGAGSSGSSGTGGSSVGGSTGGQP